MTKITKFDKQNLNLLRAKVDAALAQVGAEFGIDLKTGSIKYTDNTFEAKVSAAIGSLEEARDEKAELAFQFYAPMDGMKVEWLGQEITVQGMALRIVGYNTRAKSQPVLLKGVRDGKGYKISSEQVVRFFASKGK